MIIRPMMWRIRTMCGPRVGLANKREIMDIYTYIYCNKVSLSNGFNNELYQ